jgi:hypothetical protein
VICHTAKAHTSWTGKDEAVRIWGPIEHPTIDDIAVMILDFWDEVLRDEPAAGWSDLVM